MTTHHIPHHDIISYTFPGAPWVAYEWLADLFMALTVRLSGLSGLNVAMAALIALVSLLLYERCRKSRCHFLPALVLVTVGALASSLHWLARPHVFTFLCVYAFSSTLQAYHTGETSRKKLLLTLGVIMVFWVNLHPAFLLGFALIGLYLLCELLMVWLNADGSSRSSAIERSRTMVAALMVAVGASLINPYGPLLYRYIAHYLHGGMVLANTAEFQPPQFGAKIQPLCLELVFLAVLTGLAVKRGRCSLPQFATVAFFGCMALAAVRNVPLFVIVAVPFAAQLFADCELFPGGTAADWWRKLSAKYQEIGRNIDENERKCNMHLLPMATVTALMIIAIGGVSSGRPVVLSSGFDTSHMPSTTLDYIREHHLSPSRGFNYDNWGGYIRYRLGIPVYIDDRADFYGEPFYARYGQVSMTQPGWPELLRQDNIDWILFPSDSRLVARLKEDPHWKLVASDDAACLFVRQY